MKRKNKSYLLDRIIIIEILILSVMIGIFVGREDGKKLNESDFTPSVTITPIPTTIPTPVITMEATPTPAITMEATPTPMEDTTQPAQETMAKPLQYYMQTDARWANKYYGGTDTIGEYGCGPTSMAMVISTMTDITINPEEMCKWSNENGYWFPQQGSLHTFIAAAAQNYGLTCTGIENNSEAYAKVKQALLSGKMIVALMGKGHFTNSGHFIVVYNITKEDKVSVADPMSEENSNELWDLSIIVKEAKSWAAANGPFWAIGK